MGTDELLTSVPFFVVGHLSRHPLSSRNALIRDLVLALMSSILNQERRTWTRSVGTKNCSSPALPKDGFMILDEGQRTSFCSSEELGHIASKNASRRENLDAKRRNEELFLFPKMESLFCYFVAILSSRPEKFLFRAPLWGHPVMQLHGIWFPCSS